MRKGLIWIPSENSPKSFRPRGLLILNVLRKPSLPEFKETVAFIDKMVLQGKCLCTKNGSMKIIIFILDDAWVDTTLW